MAWIFFAVLMVPVTLLFFAAVCDRCSLEAEGTILVRGMLQRDLLTIVHCPGNLLQQLWLFLFTLRVIAPDIHHP